jgi:hypothetical protein
MRTMFETVCVETAAPWVEYDIAKKARVAANELIQLADNFSERDAIRFAERYGPLVFLGQWIEQSLPAEFHQATRSREKETFLAPFERDVLLASRSDLYTFAEWCAANDESSTWPYLGHWIALRAMAGDRRDLPINLPEPLALYKWGGYFLKRLRAELDAGRLSPTVHSWLIARLNETRLGLAKDVRRLELRALSLLSYLAAQVVLDTGSFMEFRACVACGKPITLEKDPRQKFCSSTCRERLKKARQRQRTGASYRARP